MAARPVRLGDTLTISPVRQNGQSRAPHVQSRAPNLPVPCAKMASPVRLTCHVFVRVPTLFLLAPVRVSARRVAFGLPCAIHPVAVTSALRKAFLDQKSREENCYEPARRNVAVTIDTEF